MDESGKPLALVVDDDVTGRAFLRALLRRAGYAVELASSGEEALLRFRPGTLDVVFMDIRMPGIDGIETTRRIKEMDCEEFTPVIFVTGAGDEESLVRAIDAGGDDFLTKPVTAGVLLAKLRAMARIRAVHQRTRALYTRVIDDQTLAKEVFDRAVLASAVATPALRSRLIPAEVFSGDLLLSAVSPRGRLHVLVGDFTGHGLAAALGAISVAETFRSAVAADLGAAAILERINQRLADALPRGHFFATSLVIVGRALDTLTVANCGMPALLLCGPSGVRERFDSSSFALGIDPGATFDDTVREVAIEPGLRLILASDGVTETVNGGDEAFGEARLEAVLADCRGAAAPDLVVAALDRFRGTVSFADDVSIVELCFNGDLFAGIGHSPGREQVAEAI
jgi:CheY-like chemotaxis protein